MTVLWLESGYTMRNRDFPQAQAIFHLIPLLSSQYSYSIIVTVHYTFIVVNKLQLQLRQIITYLFVLPCCGTRPSSTLYNSCTLYFNTLDNLFHFTVQSTTFSFLWTNIIPVSSSTSCSPRYWNFGIYSPLLGDFTFIGNSFDIGDLDIVNFSVSLRRGLKYKVQWLYWKLLAN